MEPSEYDFTKFWSKHRLCHELKVLKKEIELLEKGNSPVEVSEPAEDSWPSWLPRSIPEFLNGISSIGGGISPLGGALGGGGVGVTLNAVSSGAISSGMNADDRRENAGDIRQRAGNLQRTYYQNARMNEEEYLEKMMEYVRRIEEIEAEFAAEERGRRDFNGALIESAILQESSPMLQHYKDVKDQGLLMEVNEKLVCPIGKTCAHLWDIANQIQYLQFSDERWVRTECKKVLTTLKEQIRGFEARKTEIGDYINENNCVSSNPELVARIKALMFDMCNSISLVPRHCMELEVRIENKPISDMVFIKDNMNGTRGLLQVDLNNYQKVSENRLTNFGDLVIQAGEAQPQTSNNHSSYMD